MLKSMTGFGAADFTSDDFEVHIEIKAVNQRFLEIDFRMPRTLTFLEDSLRRLCRETIARGKLTFCLTFRDKRAESVSVKVNRPLAVSLHQALNEISDLLHLPRVEDASVIASFDGVLSTDDQGDVSPVGDVIMETAKEAVIRLDEMRQREGANIRDDFLARIQTAVELTDEVAALAPDIVSRNRERLTKLLQEWLSAEQIDETRIIQETALFADKINYTEEMVRLKSHFDQFRSLVENSDSPVGRQLDFLIQEMNREVNTVGSKANDSTVAKLVVRLKSEIEKLREQVQNIE